MRLQIWFAINRVLQYKGNTLSHRENFLPRSGGSGWIRSIDLVDCMSPNLDQISSRSINLGCSDHSICSALSDYLNLFMFYLINLVKIG